MAYSIEELRTYKAVTIITLFLSIYGSLKYTGVPEGDLAYTPFSGSNFLLFIYWGVLYLWQIIYTAQIFSLMNIDYLLLVWLVGISQFLTFWSTFGQNCLLQDIIY